MKANYENNEEILKGKARARKYEAWAKENRVETLDDWSPVEPGTDIDSGATVYDMAKQGAAIAPELSQEAISKLIDEMSEFIDTHKDNYYMLLCNERRDYTLFDARTYPTASHLAKDIIVCMKNRGLLVEYEIQAEGVELWSREDDDAAVYYFFPSGKMVVTYEEDICSDN